MILSELKNQIDFLCDNGHGDNIVIVTLSEPSIGARSGVCVSGIHAGFDWESGQVRISTEKKIISYDKDRDNATEPRRRYYNIGSMMRHLLICPKCENHLRKNDNYCSYCGQKVKNEGDIK